MESQRISKNSGNDRKEIVYPENRECDGYCKLRQWPLMSVRLASNSRAILSNKNNHNYNRKQVTTNMTGPL